MIRLLPSISRSQLPVVGLIRNQGRDAKNVIPILRNFTTTNFFTTSSQLANDKDASTPISKTDFPPNSSIVPTFIHNRNPRNLEKLRIGEKPVGWTLEKPGKCFWNKLSFEMTGKHINAKIEHHTGQIFLTASSKEWCIRKFLYSTRDVSAVRAVGRVLAQRCIEMGINEVFTSYTDEDRQKEKVDIFLKAFEEGGVSLIEPVQYQRPIFLDDDTFDEKGWEVYDDIVVKDFPTNLEK